MFTSLRGANRLALYHAIPRGSPHSAGASLEHFGGMGCLLVPAMLLLALGAMYLSRTVVAPA